jgi:hypothetical protein
MIRMECTAFMNAYNALDAWLGYLDFLGIRYVIAKLYGLPISRPHSVGNGDIHWYYGGQLHREDGPAIERMGSYSWYINGKLHRLDGPAIEYRGVIFRQSHRSDFGIDSAGDWYVYGVHVQPEEVKKIYDALNIANALVAVFQDIDDNIDKLNAIYTFPGWDSL